MKRRPAAAAAAPREAAAIAGDCGTMLWRSSNYNGFCLLRRRGGALPAARQQLNKFLSCQDHGSVRDESNVKCATRCITSHICQTSHATLVGKAHTVSSPCPSTPPLPSPQDSTCHWHHNKTTRPKQHSRQKKKFRISLDTT